MDTGGPAPEVSSRCSGAGLDEWLPFHAELDFECRQITVPVDQCVGIPPTGEYLWLTEIRGTGSATHPGRVKLEGTLCVFGELTRPGADPPGNGTPTGYHGNCVWVADDGDRLAGTVRLAGSTGEPGTPDFVMLEAVRFVDGGTGRFQFAEGEATAYVNEANRSHTCDGWIRYGRRVLASRG
jgi:hypothetical protein